MFDAQTTITFEKLKGKHVIDLLAENGCMKYDEELMIAAAVLSGVQIRRDHFGSHPSIRTMVKKGVIGTHLEHDNEIPRRQSRFLAAYIAVFEHRDEVHRQFHELQCKKQGVNTETEPSLALQSASA